MARDNAAEALPIEPQDEEEKIEDLTHEAEEIAPPPIPEDAGYKAGLREAERLRRETDAEIKRQIAESDEDRKAKLEEARFRLEARKNLDKIPDMTLEAEFDDPKDKEAHYKKLEAHFEANRGVLEERKKREAEEEAAERTSGKTPEERKGLLDRLKGLFR